MNHPNGCGNGKRRVTTGPPRKLEPILIPGFSRRPARTTTRNRSGRAVPHRQTAPVDALEWAREQITPTGAPETVSDDPWATVWRLPVADGVVYVKECHGRWHFEGALTAAVSARWPHVSVEVLAADPSRARL